VATCRENGHRQDTQTGPETEAKREEKHRTPKEKMERPASSRGIKNTHYAPNTSQLMMMMMMMMMIMMMMKSEK
jgi:hypothetical protein